MSWDKEIKSSRLLLYLCGGTALVLGMTLVLLWWPDVAAFFRGFIGMAIALGGLILLYMVKE